MAHQLFNDLCTLPELAEDLLNDFMHDFNRKGQDIFSLETGLQQGEMAQLNLILRQKLHQNVELIVCLPVFQV